MVAAPFRHRSGSISSSWRLHFGRVLASFRHRGGFISAAYRLPFRQLSAKYEQNGFISYGARLHLVAITY
jgi:hypothetical protein